MKLPAKNSPSPHFLEALEPRIAPAGLNENGISVAVAGSSILLHEGQGIGSGGAYSGEYYLYVEKGQALVFTTDLNGDGRVGSDEITGISAGDGLRLLSFVDIHGDIVTNLKPDGSLTDSDGNAANGLDGRIVLNSKIESITLRTVTDADLNTSIVGNNPHNRLAISDYSIFGNIYAGGGVGSAGSGILIDTAGFAAQATKYEMNNHWFDGVEPAPSIGFIYTGSAVSGKTFSFGTSPDFGNNPAESLRGTLAAFVPSAGQAGGDVIGVSAAANYHIGGIQTGDGGFGARGGDIRDVLVQGDVGTFFVKTGNGGDGVAGGNGGSVVGLQITASPTSTVAIVTGNGGQGLLGAAGQAGQLQFNGNLELYGNVSVGLGKGGDALGNAGAGTSLTNATFNLFSVGNSVPTNFISTMRAAGDLGSSTHFDFNGDGNDDVVFLTQNTQQLAVAFGNVLGGFDPNYLILDPSIYATPDLRMSPIVVGDFNGDSLPDIASASSAGSAFGGIKTFINSGNNAAGVWKGFDDPRYSPSPYGEWGATTNMAAGDFDRDGHMDIALVQEFKALAKPDYSSEIILMSGLAGADGQSDGFFAADFGKGAGTDRTKSPIAFAYLNKGAEVAMTFKATATTAGDASTDILALLTRPGDEKHPSTFQTFSFVNPGVVYLNGELQQMSSIAGLKFSVRKLTEDPTTKITVLTYDAPYPAEKAPRFDAYDFAIADVGLDGTFDPVVFGSCGEFTVATVLKGAADGTVAEQKLSDSRANSPLPSPNPATYWGIAITAANAESGKPQIPRVISSGIVNDVSRAVEVDPSTSTVAYGAMVTVNDKPTNRIEVFDVVGYGQYGAADLSNGGLDYKPLKSGVGFSAMGADNTRTMAFATFTGAVFPSAAKDFAGLLQGDEVDSPWKFKGAPLISNSLALVAGDGGFSYLGNGGVGGSLGVGSASANADKVIVGSVNVNDFEKVSFASGHGGSGFLAGGNAGSLQGIAAKGILQLYLTTKDGGNGQLGNGGNGGNISGIFYKGVNTKVIPATLLLTTGDGGFGLRGGSGGSIIGKGSEASPDVITSYLGIDAGAGGSGISAGGAGGAVSNFRPQMAVDNFWFTELHYTAGDGGSASAGPGGVGGSITSSSPTSYYNELAYYGLSLIAGHGGDGLTGGAGGAIKTFINRPSGGYNPGDAQVFGGNGGMGATGAGGAGGTISGVEVVSSPINLSAIIAGNGGLSAAGNGGVGGSLLSNKFTTETGSVVAAAGVGGKGVLSGGAGGAVSTNAVNASALNNGRVVAIAGDGGDASGVSLAQIQKENPVPIGGNADAWALFQQIWTIGAANGRGGNGGSISALTQSNNNLVSSDIIAGNGGSTINYGITSDATTGVGRGGWVTNVKLAGDAGIIDKTVPIKSYVPYGSAMGDFVADVRNGTVTSVDPTTGNVGVIVGNSGYLRNGAPATAGVAGSVSGFEARNLMSMVAGAVDRVAAIVSVSGLKLVNGGTVVGAFKDGDPYSTPVTHVKGNAYYPDADYVGVVQDNARPGGTLVDGAVLTFNYSGPSGRVFDL